MLGGGGPNVLGKDSQLHPLIPHLKSLLPMVVWATEVVDWVDQSGSKCVPQDIPKM
jgi:hypothetical protein